MKEGLVLGIDCGTQSLRAGLFRADGTLLASTSAPYATDRPRVNWAEQNPEDWWAALCQAVPRCIEEAGAPGDAVAALACDGTSCTVVFSDERGRPLRPAILWMDIRAGEEARRVERTRDPALDYCGRRISPEWLLPKVLWVQREQPDVFRNAARIVEGVDWLIYRLTGRWVTSNSNASGKRHWTPQSGWPAALYERLGLGDLVAKSPDAVAYLGQPVGTLHTGAAAALGLRSDCIVSHGGMDGWTAFVGKNCFAPGAASLVLGTSTVVILEADRAVLIDGIMGPFPDGIREGRSVYEAGQASGGSIIQWFMGLIGAENDDEAHARLASKAADIPAGSQGVVVFDAWRGNRTPYFDPLARGTICGLTLEHGPAHLYRALLEGCAYGIRNVLATLEAGGCPVAELRACGSGSANALYTRIIASVTGKSVLVSAEKDATCLGSAMCAAVAAGLHAGLPEAASAMGPRFQQVEPGPGCSRYAEYFDAYLDTYRQMKATMHRLAQFSEE